MDETTGIAIDGNAYTRPVLTFANQRAARKAVMTISYLMGLDMHTTIQWDAEKPCGETSRWFIEHPAQQVTDTAQLEEIIDWVDGETLAEYDHAWTPEASE